MSTKFLLPLKTKFPTLNDERMQSLDDKAASIVAGLKNVLPVKNNKILFIGEPGTGKKTLAALIGQQSGKEVYRIDL